MSDKIAGSWKRKQAKKFVKSSENSRYRTKEMKATGSSWSTQFHYTYNRSASRAAKQLAKKHEREHHSENSS